MPLSAAYVAGFFDGEGCVVARKNTKKRTTWTVGAQIASTTPAVLTALQHQYGGRIRRGHYHHSRYKDSWVWFVYGAESDRFFAEILPYLLIKRQQVELATRIRSLTRPQGGEAHWWTTDADYAMREEWAKQIRTLNRRGAQAA